MDELIIVLKSILTIHTEIKYELIKLNKRLNDTDHNKEINQINLKIKNIETHINK